MTILDRCKGVWKGSDHFHANRDDLCRKDKNEFVAVKNLKVYHDATPLKLQELLGADGVLLTYLMLLEFIGDVYMGIP